MKNLQLLAKLNLALLLTSSLTASSAATFSTTTSADALVTTGVGGALSANNYGGAGALAVAARGLSRGAFQSVIQFDLTAARNSFNSQYGLGQWTVQSIALQLTSVPNNNTAFFNATAAGQFNISFLQNDSWLEGTGSPITPTTDGISYNSLVNTYLDSGADQSLGTFGFGGGSTGASSFTLNISSGLNADVLGGNIVSLQLFAADNNVSYLFSSRSNANPANRPTLVITAVPEPSLLTLGGIGFAALFSRRGCFAETRRSWNAKR